MKTFTRNHWPLLAIFAIVFATAALAGWGYIDPMALVAAPLIIPIGNVLAVDPAKQLRALLMKRDGIVQAMQAITGAVAEGAGLTAEQNTAIDGHLASIAALDGDIKRLQAVLEAGRTAVAIPGNVIATRENLLEDPKYGFKSLSEFATAVRAANAAGEVDKRLAIVAAAPSTYANESAGADGGFLIPPEYSTQIFQLSLGEDAFLPYTDNQEINGNGMVFPRDETTPWGTDGVRVYWQSEAAAAAPKKPVLGVNTLRLHKLIGLVPVTNEMVDDGAPLDGYLSQKFATSIRWKTNEAIINGTGAGQPQGVMNSGAVVQVSKDGSQATNTLSILNLGNMLAQLPPGSWGTAVWLIHNTVLGALFSLNSSGFPYYLPFGAGQGPLAASPFGSLLGRPVIVTQHAAAFSSAGDVQLHDLKYVQAITKRGGVQTATSMHLYFDADAMAYRVTFRVDARPKITKAIDQAVGTPKLSPFLKLQAR
jgi:HK97 family phage major capsid protein